MTTGKISGYGGGFSGDAFSRKGDPDSFRRRHRPGDVVRGIYRGPEIDHLGWVDFEGNLLLAQFPGSPESLKPGQAVLFLVESVVPEIGLRFYDGGSGGLPLPLSALAARYDHGRQQLDVLAQEWRATVGQQAEADEASWAAFLKTTPQAAACWADIQAAVDELVRLAAPAGVRLFRFVPWVYPSAERVEMLVEAGQGGDTVLLTARLPDGRWLERRGTLNQEEGKQGGWRTLPAGTADPSCLSKLLTLSGQRTVPRFRCTV